MLTPIATPGCGFEVDLDVDDDSENLNGTMSDTSDTTVLGDIVENSVDDSVEEDSVEDSHSAETMIDTEADFDAELQNFIKPEREEVEEVYGSSSQGKSEKRERRNGATEFDAPIDNLPRDVSRH